MRRGQWIRLEPRSECEVNYAVTLIGILAPRNWFNWCLIARRKMHKKVNSKVKSGYIIVRCKA